MLKFSIQRPLDCRLQIAAGRSGFFLGFPVCRSGGFLWGLSLHSSSSSDDSACTESTLARAERVLNAASAAAETTGSPSFYLDRLQQPREQRI